MPTLPPNPVKTAPKPSLQAPGKCVTLPPSKRGITKGPYAKSSGKVKIADVAKLLAKDIHTKFTFGDTVTHVWLDAQLGICPTNDADERDRLRLMKTDILERARIILLKNFNKSLVSIRGEGYQIPVPKKQGKVAISRMSKALKREFRKTDMALNNVEINLLTNSEKNDLIMQQNILSNLRSHTKHVRKNFRQLTNKKIP